MASKYQVPFKTTKYSVLTSGISKTQVNQGLRGMMEYLSEQQTLYYQSHLPSLVEKLSDGSTPFKGSLNSLGRKLGIEPETKATYQPYNMSEMFRTLVLGKTAGYLQNETLINTITSIDKPITSITPGEVLKEYKRAYPFLKAPSFVFTQKTLTRLQQGVLHGLPRGDRVIPLWACDTHYSKLSQTGQDLHLTLPLEGVGRVTLVFRLPKSERFQGIKTSRPTITLNHKGEVVFVFSIHKELPSPQTSQRVMGVDLGLVQPFTGTVMGEGSYSQPIHPNGRVKHYSGKINHLKTHSNSLWAKECLNKERGHKEKSEILRTERLRVRSKISRLKQELAYAVANQIVLIARENNASIILEDLTWTPHSKWDHSRTQETITHKARTVGVKTRKVNPRNTSQSCPTCGGRITHSKRQTWCEVCSKNLDRDILASRNIALRALRLKTFPKSYVQVSLHTRVTRPVTPGSQVSNSPYSLPNVENTT